MDSEEKEDFRISFSNPDNFMTDFPYHMLESNEYTKKIANETFADDENIGNYKWKPLYALAVGEKTMVLGIPLKVIEKALLALMDSGDSKEKWKFFSQFEWYKAYSAHYRAKFNDVVQKAVFYPG